MKRITGLVLAALLLCGCTAQPQNETTAFPTDEATVAVVPTEPVGIYEPFSDLEIRTGGAVRSYRPNISDCYGIRAIGDDILLFSGTEKTRLTRLTGENLFTIADAELNCMIYPEDTAFQISENGITYYDYGSREIIFLDNDLKEVSRLGMSADMVGKPVLSSNRMRVYYCTADAVRVYDLETGLDQLLKSVSYPQQSVEDVLLNDTVLRCRLLDIQGMEYTIFLDARTGELLEQIQQGIQLTTSADAYFAVIPEGSMELLLFGFGEGEIGVLTPRTSDVEPWFLEAQHALVTVSAGTQASVLDYYDLNTGLRAGSVELPGSVDPWYMEADSAGSRIYLMGVDTVTQELVLCCWQLDQSRVEDDTVYSGPRHTLEMPDEAGLAECRTYADAISQAHGVQILIGMDAAAEDPWDYDLEPEYQVPVIRRELQKLEALLQSFPEGFFRQIYDTPRISLVRSITGNAQSGSVASATGIQYWYGNREYVALAAGETLEYAFFHEIFHVIDGKVLSDSSAYYDWNHLNPAGFSYFEDYSSYQDADLSAYLQDDARVIIDAYCASFPKEDRARVMEYACTAGNAHYFQSETMQNKLRTLCQGIREAFHLEYAEETFLWEQYLNEPLMP